MIKDKILNSNDEGQVIRYLVNTKNSLEDKIEVYNKKRNIISFDDIENYILPLGIKDIILAYEDECFYSRLYERLLNIIVQYNIFNKKHVLELVNNLPFYECDKLYRSTNDIIFLLSYFENSDNPFVGDIIVKYKAHLPYDKYKNIIFNLYKKENMNFDNLSMDEKIELSKIISNDKNIAPILSYHFLIHDCYIKEDEEKLINNIVNKNDAKLIYNLLTNNKFVKFKIILEKALYNTNDIEYIAYYTFYNDKIMFEKLFISLSAFSAFILLNEDLFKNNGLLTKMVNDIKFRSNPELNEINNNFNTNCVKVISKK